MANALKDIYNKDYISSFANLVREVYPNYEIDQFYHLVFSSNWDEKALKERMRHITICIKQTFPADYRKSLDILSKVIELMPNNGLANLIFPDFVEVYGIGDWEASIPALELFTQYSTSEFAVRPFIMKDQEFMMNQMLKWSLHPNEHVRRLASEGCRPRLPWGMVLRDLKEDPAPILPILNNLKEDESLYVRKSVANNLNDISKDHPNLVLEIASEWIDNHPYTKWIIKHACRTLLKQGNPKALSLFGFENVEDVQVNDFELSKEKIQLGEEINFSFTVRSEKTESIKVRIEYAIDFVKANGKRNKKLFKITENNIERGKTLKYDRTYSFRDLSTRVHYKGEHTVSVLINGEVKVSKDFLVE